MFKNEYSWFIFFIIITISIVLAVLVSRYCVIRFRSSQRAKTSNNTSIYNNPIEYAKIHSYYNKFREDIYSSSNTFESSYASFIKCFDLLVERHKSSRNESVYEYQLECIALRLYYSDSFIKILLLYFKTRGIDNFDTFYILENLKQYFSYYPLIYISNRTDIVIEWIGLLGSLLPKLIIFIIENKKILKLTNESHDLLLKQLDAMIRRSEVFQLAVSRRRHTLDMEDFIQFLEIELPKILKALHDTKCN